MTPTQQLSATVLCSRLFCPSYVRQAHTAVTNRLVMQRIELKFQSYLPYWKSIRTVFQIPCSLLRTLDTFDALAFAIQEPHKLQNRNWKELVYTFQIKRELCTEHRDSAQKIFQLPAHVLDEVELLSSVPALALQQLQNEAFCWLLYIYLFWAQLNFLHNAAIHVKWALALAQQWLQDFGLWAIFQRLG